ncbi:MAG: hypothetical protein J0I34_30335 [Pseudonocardia sp.]|uniref:hypothetical protein n=1 Tax=unclassified Pseudonocardia TaxID=2619320 RepID=UPI00086DF31D|nr:MULTISPECIES: hypothetical protein [unclassified Pseudonocardia]MBN9113070.1 hypothetical protein [Pseudonocardia sp.]ODU21661.1 MAG: hypothetical protein ABS80_17350 [Pseudonocardia sp. SCN 72-51]ODV05539.1 MAG: hypothetical protein ABT15_16895 [Pseudonocardia sp. SCN 73-27]
MRFVRLFRLPLLLLALAVGGLALAAPANAGTPAPAGHQSHDWHPPSPPTVKVKGGSTSLTVDKSTAAVLTKNKVTVTAVYGAGGKAPTFWFPITGGSVDPKTAAGTITHSGGLKIAAGKTRTAEAAAALNSTFHVTLFTKGLSIGTAAVHART